MHVQALISAAAFADAASPRSRPTPAESRHTFAGALAQASSKAPAVTPDSVLDAEKAPKSERSAPVDGHRYADITHGPRNGMHLNTSGNERDGRAFVLVKRDGREFHIYGSGKDRLVVSLKRKDDTPPAGTTGSGSA